MRRVLLVLLVAGAVAGLAVALLGRDASRAQAPLPEPDATPAPPPSPDDASGPVLPSPTTSTLVVRVRTSDGREVPAGTRAGYRRLGTPRLRAVADDAAARFTDVPVGLVELIAEAEGFRAEPLPVSVVPNQPNDQTVVLEPLSPR